MDGRIRWVTVREGEVVFDEGKVNWQVVKSSWGFKREVQVGGSWFQQLT